MIGRNARTVLWCLAGIGASIGLVAASVPLYTLFCRVTGFGGTPGIADGPSARQGEQMMTVRFDASLAKGMPWAFRPVFTSMPLTLGETGLGVFRAENRGSRAVTGIATFNVTPAKAAPYVDKIACFCFDRQTLGPGEGMDMPVSFFIDPRIAEDPDTRDVKTVTLSYTFFETPQSGRDAHSRAVAKEGTP